MRCSDAGDVVGMSPVFSVAHDQQVHQAADSTARSHVLLDFDVSL